MNAVNLIPTESRNRRQMVSLSPVTLALFGGLVGVLLAAVLYVMTANTVATRQSELAQVSAGVAGWTAAGNSYASFVNLAKERTKQLTDVRQLASSRFPWADLLGQIGGLMPRAAALSSLQASTSTTAGGATGATGATSATSATGASAPTVQLSGCAASQSVVAQTMVQLRAVKGVSGITLSSSSDAATGTTGQAAGGCPFPVAFQLAMAFTSSSATPAVTPGSTTGTSTPPTSTTTTTTAAPAASATTTAPVTAQ